MLDNANNSQDTFIHLIGCWTLVVVGAMPFAVQPFFLAVMSETYGLAPEKIGLLASADIAGIVLASFSGLWWMRQLSTTILVRVAVAAMFIGYAGVAFTQTVEQLLWLRLITGLLGHGIAFSLGTALLCRSREPDKAIAISVITQIAFASLMLWWLPKFLEATNLASTLLMLASIPLLALPLSPHVSEPSVSSEAREIKISQHFTWLLLGLICYQIGLSSIWAFIEPLGDNRGFSLEEMGQILAIVLPLSMLGSLLAGWLNTRIGRLVPIALSAGLGIMGLLLLVESEQRLVFGIAFLVHQVAWNFGIAYVYGYVAEASNGTGVEILAPGVQSLGTAVGPILAGWIASRESMDSIVWVSGAGMVACLIILATIRIYGFDDNRAKA